MHGAPALERVTRENPLIAEAATGIQRARAAVDAARVEGVPNVTAQASVIYDTLEEQTLAGIEVGVPLTIFDRNRGAVMQASAEVLAAQRELERVEQDLQRRLAKAFSRYAAARRQVDSYTREILPTASESLDLVNRAYEAGEVDYGRVLLAQRRYFDATLAWLDALEEAWQAAIQIEGLLVEERAP